MNVLVAGAGKTGIATANRLCGWGEAVTLTDSKSIDKIDKGNLEQLNEKVKLEADGYENVIGIDFDMVVTSPGIPWDSELLTSFRGRDIPVVSEVELAFRNLEGDWIAVTGTNGKSTTTLMVGEMLKAAGIPSVVCGNIGNPVIGEETLFQSKKLVVAELSSFQLEGVESFAPKVAAILNITPDHLDRHYDMKNYREIKSRIFQKQGAGDYCVLNYDDRTAASLADEVPSKVFWFSIKKSLKDGFCIKSGDIVLMAGGEETRIGASSEMKLLGRANLENGLAASSIAYCAGASLDALRKVLFSFEGLPHRMELVGEIDSVRYINDSKATNVNASIKGLAGIDNSLFVILGGRDKNGDFLLLSELIKEKRATAILVGEATAKIFRFFAGYDKVFKVGSLEEAVEFAFLKATPGSSVVLSPACASFDMFRNFEERGEAFRQIVANFSGRRKGGGVNA